MITDMFVMKIVGGDMQHVLAHVSNISVKFD